MKGGEKSKFGGTIILEMYERKMTNATFIHTLCARDSRLTLSPAGCWFDSLWLDQADDQTNILLDSR
jgi:hypothetical protein